MPAKKKIKKTPKATHVAAGENADLGESIVDSVAQGIGNIPLVAFRFRRNRFMRIGSMSASEVKANGGAFKAGVELAKIQEHQGDFAAGDILYIAPDCGCPDDKEIKHRPALGVFIFPPE